MIKVVNGEAASAVDAIVHQRRSVQLCPEESCQCFYGATRRRASTTAAFSRRKRRNGRFSLADHSEICRCPASQTVRGERTVSGFEASRRSGTPHSPTTNRCYTGDREGLGGPLRLARARQT